MRTAHRFPVAGAQGLTLALALLFGAVACDGGGTPGPQPPPPCAGPGTICSWAGNGDAAFYGEGALPLEAALFWPMDVEFGPDERGYIVDWQNHRIRRVDADGLLRVVIGNDEIGDGPDVDEGDEKSAVGVPATLVDLNHPTDLQFMGDGTALMAAWHNHKLRKYDVATGLMRVTCGGGPGFAGDGAAADKALMNQPKAVVVAANGDVFLADTRNFRIRRISAETGNIETVAGSGMRGAAGDGGPPLQAQLSFQKGLDQMSGFGDNPEPGGALALDGQGRLYIADTENHRIRRVDFAANVIETVAGDGTPGFSGDGGPAAAAQLNYPRDIEVGDDGRLYIADADNQRIRVVDPATGNIDTIAGNGTHGFGGDGGAAREASLARPFGVALWKGDLYVADTMNNRIRRVVTP